MFEITFLGTAASVPTATRSVSALLVRHESHRFLVDCGEGTQRQLIRSGRGLSPPQFGSAHPRPSRPRAGSWWLGRDLERVGSDGPSHHLWWRECPLGGARPARRRRPAPGRRPARSGLHPALAGPGDRGAALPAQRIAAAPRPGGRLRLRLRRQAAAPFRRGRGAPPGGSRRPRPPPPGSRRRGHPRRRPAHRARRRVGRRGTRHEARRAGRHRQHRGPDRGRSATPTRWSSRRPISTPTGCWPTATAISPLATRHASP